MSRVGRMPVVVPKGVDVEIKGTYVHVKGPKGELQHTFPAAMEISLNEGVVEVKRPSDERTHRSLHGMTRAIINNMVVVSALVLKKHWKLMVWVIVPKSRVRIWY